MFCVFAYIVLRACHSSKTHETSDHADDVTRREAATARRAWAGRTATESQVTTCLTNRTAGGTAMGSAGTISAFVVVGVISASSLEAQIPSHEFGVDVAIARTDLEGTGKPVYSVGFPMDVRVGFVTSRSWMLETRFAFRYFANGDVSRLDIGPGLNVLWRLRAGTGMAKQMGPYVTAGASVDLTRISSEGFDTQVTTRPSLNVGVGNRSGWGTAAFRPELFFERNFGAKDPGEFGFTPGFAAIGLRLGVSFWN